MQDEDTVTAPTKFMKVCSSFQTVKKGGSFQQFYLYMDLGKIVNIRVKYHGNNSTQVVEKIFEPRGKKNGGA